MMADDMAIENLPTYAPTGHIARRSCPAAELYDDDVCVCGVDKLHLWGIRGKIQVTEEARRQKGCSERKWQKANGQGGVWGGVQSCVEFIFC